MANLDRLLQKKTRLKRRYKQLVEDAYNLRQTDHALSDFSEYQATKVLNKINKLKFLLRDNKLYAN